MKKKLLSTSVLLSCISTIYAATLPLAPLLRRTKLAPLRLIAATEPRLQLGVSSFTNPLQVTKSVAQFGILYVGGQWVLPFSVGYAKGTDETSVFEAVGSGLGATGVAFFTSKVITEQRTGVKLSRPLMALWQAVGSYALGYGIGAGVRYWQVSKDTIIQKIRTYLSNTAHASR